MSAHHPMQCRALATTTASHNHSPHRSRQQQQQQPQQFAAGLQRVQQQQQHARGHLSFPPHTPPPAQATTTPDLAPVPAESWTAYCEGAGGKAAIVQQLRSTTLGDVPAESQASFLKRAVSYRTHEGPW